MVEAGMNLHGTRSVQKVIEVCRNTPSQVSEDQRSSRSVKLQVCRSINFAHCFRRYSGAKASTASVGGFEVFQIAVVCASSPFLFFFCLLRPFFVVCGRETDETTAVIVSEC